MYISRSWCGVSELRQSRLHIADNCKLLKMLGATPFEPDTNLWLESFLISLYDQRYCSGTECSWTPKKCDLEFDNSFAVAINRQTKMKPAEERRMRCVQLCSVDEFSYSGVTLRILRF